MIFISLAPFLRFFQRVVFGIQKDENLYSAIALRSPVINKFPRIHQVPQVGECFTKRKIFIHFTRKNIFQELSRRNRK